MAGVDPYAVDQYAWQARLREAGDSYLAADDYLKVANEELKPYRKKKKEAKAEIEELMRAHRVDRYFNAERGEQLTWQHRKPAKRRPNADQLKERCITFCKNEDKGMKLYDFLMLPDDGEESSEAAFSLRRKKVALGDRETAPTANQRPVTDIDF